MSFKVSLFIQFIQAWKRREFANFVCLALKLFRWKFPQTTQCSFKRHRHKQRAYFTVWFLSQIHCAETDWTPVWWQQEASTVLSCNFGLTLRWKWERGLWEMTDAAREGHWRGHMSSRGRTRPLSKGWGGAGSHTTWRDEAWEMQLTWTRLTPLTCQSGHDECALDLSVHLTTELFQQSVFLLQNILPFLSTFCIIHT